MLGFGEWGWPDKHTYVFTSGQLDNDKPYISITHNSPLEFSSKFKDRTSDKEIWLLGGAQLAQNFAQEGLMDEVILTIIPQTLGEGIPLGLIFEKFDLTAEKALTDGMIQKIYLRKEL